MTGINLSPLRVRDFRVTILSIAISAFGDGVTSIALAFAVLDATGSASDVGFVLASGVVAQAVLLLFGGVIADRRQRNRVMAFAQFASGACQAFLAILLLSSHARLWALMVTYACLGCAQAVFRPGATGLIPELLAAEDLPAANGLLSIAQGGAFILGPALGGVVVTLARPGTAIAIDSSTFFISSIMLFGIRNSCLPGNGEAPRLVQDLMEGWRIVRSRSWIWSMIGFFGIFQFIALGGLGVLGPFVARSRLGGAGVWGVMMSALAVGALVGGALALRWRPKRLLVGACVSIFGSVPVFIALSLAAPTEWEVIAMFLFGCGTSYTDALWISAIQANVPADKISRVSSYDLLGSTALYPLGLAVAGPAAIAIGVTNVLRGAAVLITLSALLLLSAPSIWRVGLQEFEHEEISVSGVEEPMAAGEQ